MGERFARTARPPRSFPNINVQTVAKGAILHRTHAAGFRPAEFNPCKGQPTRFAPFTDAAGACVPTLYVATSREAAAFELIFHDIEPAAPFKTVRLDVVELRSVSAIAPKRDLLVARLFAPDLKAWSLSRGELIDTPKSTLWPNRCLGSGDSPRPTGPRRADLDVAPMRPRSVQSPCSEIVLGRRISTSATASTSALTRASCWS